MVLAAITEGLSDEQISQRLAAAGIKMSQPAISKWRRKNPEQIQAVVERIEKDIEDYAVGHKVNRIATLDKLAAGLEAALDQHGYVYSEETRHSVRYHANPAAAELRATLKDAALERDQLPRAGITIANQNVVIVKQVTTEDANPEL